MAATDPHVSRPASLRWPGGRRGTPAQRLAEVAASVEHRSRPIVVLLLVALGLLMAAFLFHETAGNTLYRDDWTWALQRRGNDLDTFLRPHYGHFSLIPIAIYRVLFALGGMTDYRPFRAGVILVHLACVAVVFAYARARVGDLLAGLAATLLLVFGPAAQNIIWPFQIGFLLSLASGGAALLALDRRTRAGDAVATGLLAVSLGSSGVGIPVALGLGVEVLTGRRSRRGLLILLSLVPYAVWWLAYQTSQTGSWGVDVYLTPAWVLSAPAAAASAMFGLGGPTGIDGPYAPFAWGAAFGIGLILVLVRRVARLGRLTPRLAALLTMAVSFWAITALGRAFFGGPVGGRYLYVGGFFLLLAAVEAARGVIVGRRTAIVLVGVVAFACVSNIGAYRTAAAELRAQSQLARVELGALGLARPLVRPDYVAKGFFFGEIVAGPYFRAADELGSPAASEAEIAGSSTELRAAADDQLATIHRVRLLPATGAPPAGGVAPSAEPGGGATAAGRGACLRLRPPAVVASDATAGVRVALPRAGVLIRAGSAPVTVGVRRFADTFRPVGVVAPGAAATLVIGPDASARPWHAEVDSGAPASVCSAG